MKLYVYHLHSFVANRTALSAAVRYGLLQCGLNPRPTTDLSAEFAQAVANEDVQYDLMASVDIKLPEGPEPELLDVLERAFTLTNHSNDDWSENEGVTVLGDRECRRSTSIGDLIYCPVRRMGFLVLSNGYEPIRVPESILPEECKS